MEAKKPNDVRPDGKRSIPLKEGVRPEHGNPLEPSKESKLERGSILGDRFVLLNNLGTLEELGFFRVFDTSVREMRALQLFREDSAREPNQVARFSAEVEKLVSLEHPNLVGIHDSAQLESGALGLVQEFVAGAPFKSFITPKLTLPLRAALEVVAQVVEGLHHAHQAGVLHGNFCAENILVVRVPNRKTTARLIHFKMWTLDEPWLPASADEPTPELLDTSGDIHALGRLLYEVIAPCCRLVSSNSTPDVSEPEALAPYAASLGVPETLLVCIDQCLKADPAQRPGDAEVILQQLKLAIEALPDLGDNQPKTGTLAAVSSERGSEQVTLQDWHLAEQPTLSSIEDLCPSCGATLAKGAVCFNCRRNKTVAPPALEALSAFPDDFFDAEPPRLRPTFQALWTASLGVLRVIANEEIARRTLREELEKTLNATLVRYGCEEVEVVATEEGFRLILIAIDAVEGDMDDVMQSSAQVLLNVVGATIKAMHQDWSDARSAGICGAVAYGTVIPSVDPEANPDDAIKGSEADLATRLQTLAKPWEVLGPSELFEEEDVRDTLLVATRDRSDSDAEAECRVSVWLPAEDSSRFFIEKGS